MECCATVFNPLYPKHDPTNYSITAVASSGTKWISFSIDDAVQNNLPRLSGNYWSGKQCVRKTLPRLTTIYSQCVQYNLIEFGITPHWRRRGLIGKDSSEHQIELKLKTNFLEGKEDKRKIFTLHFRLIESSNLLWKSECFFLLKLNNGHHSKVAFH